MIQLLRFMYEKCCVLWRKGNSAVLAFFWIAGLTCGVVSGYYADTSIISMMRRIPDVSVSIVYLLSITALPFLLYAFAFFLGQPWLLLPVSFGKAFTFSYVSCCIMQAWHEAGWLAYRLLLFYDCVSAPILYFFWRRALSENRPMRFGELFLLFSAVFLIGSIDIRIISPFWAGIIDF